MKNYELQAFLQFDDGSSGNAAANQSFNVTIARGANVGDDATIYSDADGTTEITRPFQTDQYGRFKFYAANGYYNILFDDPDVANLNNLLDRDIFEHQDIPSDTKLYAMTKVEFNALAEQRKRDNAGSGFLEWGKHLAASNERQPINEGMWANPFDGFQSTLLIGRAGSTTGVSRTDEPICLVNGVQHTLSGYNPSNPVIIKFPQAPDGTKTYNSATGAVTQHADATAAFADETATNKVITSRKDLVLLEAWYEAIEDKDEVYPLGNVQYGATTYGGITLSARNDGYTRFGEWDTTTVGYKAAWSSLTDEQKLKFISNPENNIYYDEETDKFIQARYRVRVIEGKYDYPSRNDAYTDAGLTQASDAGLLEYDEFKVIPIALVQRLNQGAYHPTYNPQGCRAFAKTGVSVVDWHSPFGDGTSPNDYINSTLRCFIDQSTSGDNVGFRHVTGRIGDTESGGTGRSDQYKFFDAIYAGMVEDLRLNANKLDYSRLLQNGFNKATTATKRGKGKVPFTKVYNLGAATNFDGGAPEYSRFEFPLGSIDFRVRFGTNRATVSRTPYFGWIVSNDGTQIYPVNEAISSEAGLDRIYIPNDITSVTLDPTGYHYVAGIYELQGDGKLSGISENYEQFITTSEYDSLPWVDIVGDPERIAATFPDGVIGQWIPVLPLNSTVEYPLSRKANQSNLTRIYTANNGTTWTKISTAIDAINNSFSNADGQLLVSLNLYESLSEFTEPVARSAVVKNANLVWLSNNHLESYGNRLAGSVLGLITKEASLNISTTASYGVTAERLTTNSVYAEVQMVGANVAVAPDSKAFRTLPYLIEANGLLYLEYLSQELYYNGSSWGFDTNMQLKDGDSTYTDLNGVTLKATCHRDLIPIGIADKTESN